MIPHVRMRLSQILFLTLLSCGCAGHPAPFASQDRAPRSDREAPVDPPSTYPGWAYDAPSYMKPAEEIKPQPKARPSDPLHYFTKDKVVMVRQPSGYRAEEIPRVAIWWTNNNGFHWHKAGYFGREMSYFPFQAEEDGDYGVRFVGPGQDQATVAPAYPERVYHVDTIIPEVEVSIDPEQTWYTVGQSITVSWRSEDYHLIETPVSIFALADFSAEEKRPIEIQKDLAAEGSITYEIPADFLNREVRFRVDALDRADNLGIAYSPALQIVTETSNPQFQETGEAQAVSMGDEGVEPSADSGRLSTASDRRVIEYDGRTGLSIEDGARIAEEEVRIDTAMPAPATTIDMTGPFDPMKLVPFGAAFARKADDLRPGEVAQRSKKSPRHEVENLGSPKKAGEDHALAISKRRAAEQAAEEPPRVDLTCGNGLMIPFPATIEPADRPSRWALAHPWRVLRKMVDVTIRTVWVMPKARPGIDAVTDFEARFLADHPALRDVLEPPGSRSEVASLPEDPANISPDQP